jgi:4-hydroxy-tetrahydrodipicolinate synthase
VSLKLQLPLRRGSTVALVTPFEASSGNIDVPSLRRLLQYHVESQTDNLCLLGTTAEAGVLSMAERELVLKVASEEVKGQIPIMVGCGTINPLSVKAMVQQAVDLGADAALIVTPYYVKPPQRSLITHFVQAADYGLPVVLYNVPSRTGVDMSDASIATAAQHDNVVAVKDATGKLERLAVLRGLLATSDTKNVLLYSGDDETSMDFVLQGGDGCISVTANVAAPLMQQIMAAAMRGDRTAASDLNWNLLSLHDKLFCEANPIPVKYALARMGLIQSAYCRPPLDFLDSSHESTIDAALERAGLLAVEQ